jgi:ankyrin repeat protein
MKRQGAESLDSFGRSDLHRAVVKGDLLELRRLLNDGLDPNLQDATGMTPLHFAAQEWHPDLAQTLLEGGARVDVQAHSGNTALFDAVYNSRGRGEVIEVLLTHGANPACENRNGLTPFSLAVMIGNFDVARYFPSGG